FTVYFIPSVFNVIHSSIILTLTVKIVMLVYAFFMWWAIINPVRRLNDLAPLVRIGYIFFASLALMPIGFFFCSSLPPLFLLFRVPAVIFFQLCTLFIISNWQAAYLS